MSGKNKSIPGMDVIRNSNKIDNELFEYIKKSAEFHGHLCPGLAVGIIAGKIALKDELRSEDEEMVAIVENDACGVDAIQALTGCTFGKGNLIFMDYGKSVYTFFYRNTGKAFRFSLHPDVFKKDDSARMNGYFRKVKDGTATESDTENFWNYHFMRTKEILERGEAVFSIAEINMKPPENARIFESIDCEGCNEKVMATRVKIHNDKKFCIPCFESHMKD